MDCGVGKEPLYRHGAAGDAEVRARLARTMALLRRLAGRPGVSDDELRRQLCRDYPTEIETSLSAVLAEVHRRVGRSLDPKEWRHEVALLCRAVGLVGSVARGVPPPDLASSGLGSALRFLGDRLERMTGAEIAVEIGDLVPGLVREKELCLYHLARFAVTAAIHDRGARSVRVGLHQTQGTIELCVADDGSASDELNGMDSSFPNGSDAIGGELLDALHEVILLGGGVVHESDVITGARVTARLPTRAEILFDAAEPEGSPGRYAAPANRATRREPAVRRQTSVGRTAGPGTATRRTPPAASMGAGSTSTSPRPREEPRLPPGARRRRRDPPIDGGMGGGLRLVGSTRRR
jgi:hypothetical protein